MALIGFHSSSAGGVEKSVDRAYEQGVNTFQLFLNAPRIWKYSQLNEYSILKFKENLEKYKMSKPIAHLSYLPNPATSDRIIREKTETSLKEAIKRCDLLGIYGLVVHINSHKGKGIEIGMLNVQRMLEQVIDAETSVKLLMETSSGSPKLVGNTFSELGKIIDGVSDPKKMGVCFDTCHVFASGYDLVNHIDEVFDEFDGQVGLDRLNVFHMNDSKGELGGKRDRHEHIGLGKIGLDPFSYILNDKQFQGTPFIIETPNDKIRNDQGNLNVLRELVA